MHFSTVIQLHGRGVVVSYAKLRAFSEEALEMYSSVRVFVGFFALASCTTGSFAQGSQASAPPKPANPLELKAPGPGEDKAYKAFQKFQSVPDSDLAGKTKAAEDFLNKFPNSTYNSYADAFLTVAYIQAGQVDKGLAAGEKALQLNPSDFRTMGVMSQTLSRTVADNAPDTAAKLEKAETYAKNTITGVATWVKPDSMSEGNFTGLKNETLTMGHASLGLVAIHRGNFEGAIPDLEQAVQLGTNTDPTNYYLLGIANQNSSHYDKAAEAFEKCAAVKGTNLTSTCTSLADQAKRDATQAKSK